MGRPKKPRAVTTEAAGVAEAPANDAKLSAASTVWSDAAFPEEPPAELVDMLVTVGEPVMFAPPAPTLATPPLRRPAPRRVSADVVKAETALLNLERRRQESLAHAESVWAAKRSALIKALPDDVYQALVAMKVLPVGFDDLEPLGE